MQGYLSTKIISSEKGTVFREDSCEGHLMPTDKYPSTLLRQMGTTVCIILEIFSQHCSFQNWEISLGCSPLKPIASEQDYLMDYKRPMCC